MNLSRPQPPASLTSLGGAAPPPETHTQRLDSLMQIFDGIERNSMEKPPPSVPEFVYVRLDGFEACGEFLKHSMSNFRFETARDLALADTARHIVRKTGAFKRMRPMFVHALALSDEVTFLMAPKFGDILGRPLKMSTVFAGILSSYATLHYRELGANEPCPDGMESMPSAFPILSFDARPAFIDSLNYAHRYFELRWLFHFKNTMAKALRLHSSLKDCEIYESGLTSNLEKLQATVRECGVEGFVEEGLRDVKLFSFDLEGESWFRQVASHEALASLLWKGTPS